MMKPWIDKAHSEKPKKSLPANLAVNSLKLCPLCESLNARSNQVCFVCGWHGSFIHDSRSLHTSLVLLLEQCPELADEAEFTKKPTILKRLAFNIASGFEALREKIVNRFTRRNRPGRHIDLWI